MADRIPASMETALPDLNFNAVMFGAKMAGLFADVKHMFDPKTS